MITDEDLPDGWQAESARTERDSVRDREFESRRYRYDERGETVFINEVQEPKDLGGWGYQVVVEDDDGTSDEVAVVDDLETAREEALEYMKAHGDG